VPRGSWSARWGALLRGVVFFDLRGWVEAAAPGWWLHRMARVQVGGADQGRPVPYTLFGWVLLPAWGLGLLAAAWRGGPGSRRGVLVLCLLWVGWSIGLPCLVDGQEANRMRFASLGVLLVGGALAAAGTREPPSPGGSGASRA